MKAASTTRRANFSGDTLSLFEALASGRNNTMLLESKDGNGKNNIQSLLFLGCALRIEGRGPRVEIKALTPNGESALEAMKSILEELGQIEELTEGISLELKEKPRCGNEDLRVREKSTADVLRMACNAWIPVNESQPPTRLPGVFAYDFIERFESLPEAAEDRHDFPDFVFWLPETTVVVDHATDTAVVETTHFGKKSPIDDLRLESEATTLQEKIGALVQSDSPSTEINFSENSQPDEVKVDLSDSEYVRLVENVKEHIICGDVFQIVPSRTFSLECPDPAAAYDQLRKLNPSPYLFLVRHPDFTLFGASPETCLKVSGFEKAVEIHPIAGTRRRGVRLDGSIDQDLDSRREAELKLNEKEIAEHMMLVDLARNDIARISKPGTRVARRLLEVERYSHVMHLTSVVAGELKDDLDALHAYLTCSNMGTLVGAPKIEAARLLRKFELDRRGPYGGAVGYFTSDGELDSAIVIRAALVTDGVAHVRAGAGVVYDSDPISEADETRAKAMAVISAIHRARKV